MFKFKLSNLLKVNEAADGAPIPKECSLLELFQMSLKDALNDIGEYVASQVVQQDQKDIGGGQAASQAASKPAAAKKKAINDFFGGDSDDDDDFDLMGGGGMIDFDNIKPQTDFGK